MKIIKRNIVILSSDVLCATLFFLASALLLSASANAQGYRVDGVTQARSGFPAPAVTIAVCAEPATITTTPCSTLTTLYTDSTLATACTGTLQSPPTTPGGAASSCSNPLVADGLGNYHYYVANGRYALQFYGSGITAYAQRDQIYPCINSCIFNNINGYIYVDGVKYAKTVSGIQQALNDASAAGGGTVILPVTGTAGITISTVSSNFVIPSNVCLVGAGAGYQTVLFFTATPSTAALILSAGTTHACVKDLQLNFSAGASTNAVGIQIQGDSGSGSATQLNTFENIKIIYGALSAGSIGIWAPGTASALDVSINTFKTIAVTNADQMVRCDNCEGNDWIDVQGVNLGKTNGIAMFQETNSGDEHLDIRVESGSGGPGTNIICYKDGAASSNNFVNLTCDTATVSTAVSDLGNRNTFLVSLIGSPTIGTLATTSTAIVTPASGSSYATAPSFQSRSSNISASGVNRLASSDTNCWRNNANSSDICLSKDTTDNLSWNSLGLTGSWNCTNITPVTVNTSTTADQNVMACTLPAGVLNRVNRTLRVAASGIYSTPAASTAQMTVKIKLCTVSGCGSGTVITPISIQSTALGTVQITNDNWSLSSLSTTQTAGASSAYEAHGDFLIDLSTLTTAADSAFGDTNTATVGTIDSTAQLFLQCTFAFSAASGSNSATQRQLVVETIN